MELVKGVGTRGDEPAWDEPALTTPARFFFSFSQDDAVDRSSPFLTRGVWDTVRAAEEEEEAVIKAAAAARALLTAAGRSVAVTEGHVFGGSGGAAERGNVAADVSAEALLRAAEAVSAGAKLAARGGGSLRRIPWGFD